MINHMHHPLKSSSPPPSITIIIFNQRNTSFVTTSYHHTWLQINGNQIASSSLIILRNRWIDFQDRAKAAQFLPFLQRAGRSSAIVEFVASGSRFRLYLPKETCQITFLLAGISCPKVKSFTPQGNMISEGEPYGDEAFDYSKEHCMQREVNSNFTLDIHSISHFISICQWSLDMRPSTSAYIHRYIFKFISFKESCPST